MKNEFFLSVLLASLLPLLANGGSYNLRIVTDASPDYHDLPSMIHSISSRWETAAEKCWALFYWIHIARRQTSPMILHGTELTDPIRQFNDYGYAMCSTVAGINCALWSFMGLKTRFWDIHAHTVPEVWYDGGWHMYDNSMSALYTLCDGVTIAGVEAIGAVGGCTVSGGKREKGHIARYHCLHVTGENSFLTGADCARSLAEEARCFAPSALKNRWYYRNHDWGHRYLFNLRSGEAYTRHYRSQGTTGASYVPNNGKDPEAVNTRYRIRGNGIRIFKPALTPASLRGVVHTLADAVAVAPRGVEPATAGRLGEVVFKVEGANVLTSLAIRARVSRRTSADVAAISISVTNGRNWKDLWTSGDLGEQAVELNVVDPVNGAYEVLVKVSLTGQTDPAHARLEEIAFEAVTMLNSKTQPQLNWGRNTVYVGAGDQVESVVIWPDLRRDAYLPFVSDHRNISAEPTHPGYQGVLHAAKAREEAYVIFRVDAPRPIVRLTYGGRFYNRAPESRIDLLHSFDNGATWQMSYSLTDTEPPWDVIHYETIDAVPRTTTTALCKYRLTSSAAGTSACSVYSVRMQADYEPAARTFVPVEVTFNWSEVQEDYSRIVRSHTKLVTALPCTYTIDVGGADHPAVNWLRVNTKGAVPGMRHGYASAARGFTEKYTYRWVTYGKNLAAGKPYTVSVPSNARWDAGDPEGVKLTDGVVGPHYAGGIGPRYALCWDKGTHPVITVDLGRPLACRAFRIHLSAGWPWWDALKGEVRDTVEVLTSVDGHAFESRGFFDLNLRRKDIPVNHLLPDDETATGFTYDLVLPKAVEARYARYRIEPARTVTVSEVMVLDAITYRPFDLKIALPHDDR